jgi:hypothetical protein
MTLYRLTRQSNGLVTLQVVGRKEVQTHYPWTIAALVALEGDDLIVLARATGLPTLVWHHQGLFYCDDLVASTLEGLLQVVLRAGRWTK